MLIYIYLSLSLINMFMYCSLILGFPGGTSGKELARQCRRPMRSGFKPWVRKILWRTAQQPTPVFLPGESHGQILAGYSLQGCKELDTTEVTQHTCMHSILKFYNINIHSSIGYGFKHFIIHQNKYIEHFKKQKFNTVDNMSGIFEILIIPKEKIF